MIIGIEITLVTKIRPAKIDPTTVYVMRKPMFSGSISMARMLAFSGMVLKLTANTTREARPQSISRISNTPAKMAIVLLVGRQDCSEALSEGRWSFVCIALLASYRPRKRKGPMSRKPALSAST